MKKTIITIICLVGILSGCQKNSNQITHQQKEEYLEYREAIMKNKGRTSSDLPFSYRLDVQKNDKGKYVYTLIVDQPQVVMQNIQMMVVDNEDWNTKMMCPNIGIIDQDKVSLIPNQSDVQKGVPKGIALNGEVDKKDFSVDAMITYKDDNDMDAYRYFIHVDVKDGKVVKENKA